MNTQRAVALGTGVVACLLAVAFLVVSPGQADHIATLFSAVVAVVSLGVAVWALVPVPRRGVVRVVRTGDARASGAGSAVSGAAVSGAGAAQAVDVLRTGTADASDQGEATSGFRRS
ncbi:hypothetical protein ACM01_38165 [Streptomyces viridochromogenes]|uniref:Uncharacterized protein n=1 Tax=Streptomyces viridochromogenes TaxID=1938 RepID=A0A0J7YZZ1_STRVR|nr:hypothetical protein [Streptomyces viridochromogenes]KMS68608.1 hypothetical protein ACM01_38165 [Streptomyces viridochromogenes]KOG23814.1 hypothetical protein ADK36_09275 [Streptomyces viridochromogenes]KOG24802.1 hypothetical protein ADK35_10360 [Streptomyces viridochromogenes]